MSEMLSVTFPVYIAPTGEMDVCIDLTQEDLEQLIEAEESGESFSEIEALHELYNNVLDAAYDEIANYIFDNQYVIDTYLGGKYDFNQARKYAMSAYEISIDYPMMEED